MGSTEGDVDAILAECDYCERDWFDDELPEHIVYLEAFWVDRTEVTNRQFRRCVRAGACEAPTTCDWGEPSFGGQDQGDRPVVCVSWDMAQAYCQWTGARLPTEAEWEKAARGDKDRRQYPWGDRKPDCSLANFGGPDGCSGDTDPVGARPAGKSPYGALDMAGNVWEWVADWYDPAYYALSPAQNPRGPAGGLRKVFRGGSWGYPPTFMRAADRARNRPTYAGFNVGFRCAMSAPP
jgi:formylglycine-generating enzyme required for sulfatase activity